MPIYSDYPDLGNSSDYPDLGNSSSTCFSYRGCRVKVIRCLIVWLKFCLSKKTYTLSRINRLDLSVDFLSFCLGNVWSFRDFTW